MVNTNRFFNEGVTEEFTKPIAICQVCSRKADGVLILQDSLDDDLAGLIRTNAPDTKNVIAACERCVNLFKRARTEIETDAAMLKDGSHVLSTPLRMDAINRYTGKGVTIAFLDSGFYPHDDLVKPKNRIIAYRNIVSDSSDISQLFESDVASWHGMMTSVVAAGNGWSSHGFYRGIAPEAKVALVKLAKTGRISEQAIKTGLQWVLENKDRYNIKIVNISAGGDFEQSYLSDSLSLTVEECARENISVVCAVGNAGHLSHHPVFPPASAPSAIAVGGLDDKNSINRAKRGMYRSSYGPTVDGFQKPEIIAPGIWVPAPILPNTPTAIQVNLLEKLDQAPDSELHGLIKSNEGILPELDAALDLRIHNLRQIISLRLSQEGVITKHYKYVDGTSFAAPIVSSIVAQMLEANPDLTPPEIRRILVLTAERLPNYDVNRQGWGVVDPRSAVEMALNLNKD